ncbi:MAG TPA: hypothetical protein PKW37_01610 [Salinivirgaceae bacterium]|nr:hypothetical protein [Salinivirgaceae bacterium]
MKNKLFNVIVALTVAFSLSLYFSNCTKNETINKDVSKIEKYNDAFRKLGERHNQCLDYVAENGDVSIMSRKERFELARKFFNSNTTWEEHETRNASIMQIVTESTSASNLLRESKNERHSDEFLTLIDKLESILNETKASWEKDIEISPTEFNAKINSLIDEVYQDYDVIYDDKSQTVNEFGYFIAGCNIAKSTYQYWHDANNDPQNPWYNYLREAKVPKFFRWIAVAAVDVWGFITSADVDITWNDGFSVTVSFDLNEALENAGEASSSV